MAFSEDLVTRTMITTADLSAKQFCAVYNGTVANATKNMDGILQDNPVSGKAACIATRGISKAAISASQTLTAGVTLLEVDTGGTLKAVASGTVVAKAMESLVSTTAVAIIAVEIEKSAAVFV